MSCFVKNCRNAKRLLPKDSNITLHRFPRGALFSVWLKAIGKNENLPWKQYRYICSAHFTEADRFKKGGERVYIRPNAIPSLNLNNGLPQENVVASTHDSTDGATSSFHTDKNSTNDITSTQSVKKEVSEVSTWILVASTPDLTDGATSSFHSDKSSTSDITSTQSVEKEVSKVSTWLLVASTPDSTDGATSSFHSEENSTNHITSTQSEEKEVSEVSNSILEECLTKSDTLETISASTLEDNIRKNVNFIQTIHSYSLKSPLVYKTKYECTKTTLKKSRQELHLARKSIKKLKQKVDSLKLIIKELKKNQTVAVAEKFTAVQCDCVGKNGIKVKTENVDCDESPFDLAKVWITIFLLQLLLLLQHQVKNGKFHLINDSFNLQQGKLGTASLN